MNRSLEQSLRKTLCAVELPQPREECLRATISRCQAAYQSRRRRKSLGSLELIAGQLRFIAAPVWALQMALLLCISLLLWGLSAENALFHLPAFLRLASILVAMTMLPFYGRARRYRMAEIERAARLSRGKLILAKLSAVGVGDAVCLTVLTLSSAGKIPETANTLLSCILLPFLLACTGLLLIVNHTKEERSLLVAAAFGVALAAAGWMLPAIRMPRLPLNAAACAALLAMVGLQCRRLLQKTASIEDQDNETGDGIWNWNCGM